MKLDEEKLRGMLCEMSKKQLMAALLSFVLLLILVVALYFARAYGDREAAMEPRVSHHVDLHLLYSFLVRGAEDPSLGAPFKVYPIDVDKYHATLVEYPFGSSPRKVDSLSAPRGIVLYVHGFSDYFFQKEMAEKVDSAGYAFFAVDLHGYGRSARPGEPFSDMRFASEFFMEINYAMEMGWHLVKSEQERRVYATVRDSSSEVITKAMLSVKRPPNILVGHSQGGLISSLYLDEFQRDDIGAVVLNSPFLEMNYSLPVRKIAFPLLASVALYFPDFSIGSTGNGNYARSLYKGEKGEWDYNTEWKPFKRPETHLHWIRAIYKAQSKVHAGLHVKSPVLVMHSGCSVKSDEWVDEYLSCDGVLDAGLIRDAAPQIGPNVKTLQIDGGMHDVFISKKEVRDGAYDSALRFIDESLAGKRAR